VGVIWASEKIPEIWRTAVICPILRTGEKLQRSNYRGIPLLTTCYYVLNNILLRRLVPYAEETLGDYQIISVDLGKENQLLIIYLR
jgi:hypothetical protein